MATEQGAGKTNYSQGNKDHEAARTFVFNNHIHMEENHEGTAAGCA